jgi:hypothetical protein
MEQQGAAGKAILKDMADTNWAKLQDKNQFDYGVKQFAADYDATLPFLRTVEGLGLSLLIMYNNSRKERTAAEKAKDNKQASEDSDRRIKAWEDVFPSNKTTAYKLLLSDIKRQTQVAGITEAPTPQTPMIRSLVRKRESQCENKDGEETLDACFLNTLNMGDPNECWVPVRRSNPRVEWKFTYNDSSGRWTMTNALFPQRIQWVLSSRHQALFSLTLPTSLCYMVLTVIVIRKGHLTANSSRWQTPPEGRPTN